VCDGWPDEMNKWMGKQQADWFTFGFDIVVGKKFLTRDVC
jgi:hypothetical protein